MVSFLRQRDLAQDIHCFAHCSHMSLSLQAASLQPYKASIALRYFSHQVRSRLAHYQKLRLDYVQMSEQMHEQLADVTEALPNTAFLARSPSPRTDLQNTLRVFSTSPSPQDRRPFQTLKRTYFNSSEDEESPSQRKRERLDPENTNTAARLYANKHDSPALSSMASLASALADIDLPVNRKSGAGVKRPQDPSILAITNSLELSHARPTPEQTPTESNQMALPAEVQATLARRAPAIIRALQAQLRALRTETHWTLRRNRIFISKIVNERAETKKLNDVLMREVVKLTRELEEERAEHARTVVQMMGGPG